EFVDSEPVDRLGVLYDLSNRRPAADALTIAAVVVADDSEAETVQPSEDGEDMTEVLRVAVAVEDRMMRRIARKVEHCDGVPAPDANPPKRNIALNVRARRGHEDQSPGERESPERKQCVGDGQRGDTTRKPTPRSSILHAVASPFTTEV